VRRLKAMRLRPVKLCAAAILAFISVTRTYPIEAIVCYVPAILLTIPTRKDRDQ
jgi:hypothetical protein